MNEIMQWASFIRDIGLILGIPTLVVVGIKLYSQQIEILKARNDLLKETQYDRAVSLIEAQKKAFLLEREILDKQIADLERSASEKQEKIDKAIQSLEDHISRIRDMMDNAIGITKEELELVLSQRKTPEDNN